jgi:hypothetical protein
MSKGKQKKGLIFKKERRRLRVSGAVVSLSCGRFGGLMEGVALRCFVFGVPVSMSGGAALIFACKAMGLGICFYEENCYEKFR